MATRCVGTLIAVKLQLKSSPVFLIAAPLHKTTHLASELTTQIRECEEEMRCRLYNVSQGPALKGPALKGPEQWGATHLKPSQMSTGTFNDFLLGLDLPPSWLASANTLCGEK